MHALVEPGAGRRAAQRCFESRCRAPWAGWPPFPSTVAQGGDRRSRPCASRVELSYSCGHPAPLRRRGTQGAAANEPLTPARGAA